MSDKIQDTKTPDMGTSSLAGAQLAIAEMLAPQEDNAEVSSTTTDIESEDLESTGEAYEDAEIEEADEDFDSEDDDADLADDEEELEQEEGDANTFTVKVAGEEVQVDLDELIQLTQPVPPLEHLAALPPLGQRISIARDAAFGFIYPHILSDWHRHGSELHFFSPLANEAPASNCEAVFLPGGYPELSAGAISAAENFKAGVQTAVANGAAIYGECGGYMVLGRALIDEHGAGHPMLGLLSHVTSFKERRRQLGYRKLRRIADAPLPLNLRGHEFHYSTIDSAGQDAPLFEVTDSKGRNLGAVGGARERVFGSYMHMIDVSPGT